MRLTTGNWSAWVLPYWSIRTTCLVHRCNQRVCMKSNFSIPTFPQTPHASTRLQSGYKWITYLNAEFHDARTIGMTKRTISKLMVIDPTRSNIRIKPCTQWPYTRTNTKYRKQNSSMRKGTALWAWCTWRLRSLTNSCTFTSLCMCVSVTPVLLYTKPIHTTNTAARETKAIHQQFNGLQ